jgi:hypothetical protein
MLLPSLFGSLKTAADLYRAIRNRRRLARKRQAGRKPYLEVLEDRTLLTASFQWFRQFDSVVSPSGHSDIAFAVATSNGNIYVAGMTSGALPGQILAGSLDAFVRKYDANGNELWTRQFGTAVADSAEAISVDASGIYVAGGTEGTLPGQVSSGGFHDAFVRKYDVNGNELWTRQFGTSDTEVADGIAVDASGIYVAGGTGGTFPGQSSAGGGDAFVRKYDLNGNEVWTRQFGTASGDGAREIVADASGIYVAGYTVGTFPGQSNSGLDDAFVRNYDANGNEVWTRQFGTASGDNAFAVTAHASGIYVAGQGGTFPGQSNSGPFVRKYDANGNEAWTRQFGAASGDQALGIQHFAKVT